MTEEDQQPETPDEKPERTPEETPPLLRIITPDTTPEEIAALVAVLSAMSGGEPSAPEPRRQWNAPARAVRGTHRNGLGGWRASSLPR